MWLPTKGKPARARMLGMQRLCGPGGGGQTREPGLSDSPMQGSSSPPRSLPQLFMKFGLFFKYFVLLPMLKQPIHLLNQWICMSLSINMALSH